MNPFVQIPDHGSETLDGEVSGDLFSEYEDEEEVEPEEETWSRRFMEYLDELVRDEDFVSMVDQSRSLASHYHSITQIMNAFSLTRQHCFSFLRISL